MKIQYRCHSCGMSTRLPEEKIPGYCPYCGSTDIDIDREKARETAGRMIAECNEILRELKPAHDKYISILARYELNMQTLRCYKKRGVVSEDEMPHWKKTLLPSEMKKLRNARKEAER